MHVLHVFKDAFPPTYGGVEQHVWDVTRSLAGRFPSTVLTSSRSRRRVEEDVDGVRIVRVPEYGRVLSTPVTPAWWRELRRGHPDVIHVHLPLPVAELALLARWPAAPVVASWYADVARSPGLAPAYRRVQQRFLSRADRIVVSSRLLADRSPALAAHGDRVSVVPFGSDPGEWPADPARVAELRTAAGGSPVVLFLGRLVRYKGVDVLLEAMRGVDAALVVVGDGPERRGLERVASGLRARFVGPVTNEARSAYYQAADVFVLPAVSRAETFGIAMLEAMSFGTPVVSTEVGTGTSWVNAGGETGLVVPPRDPAALARAIRAVLADDLLRASMARAAAERARRHFSKRAMLDGLAEVYSEVAGEHVAVHGQGGPGHGLDRQPGGLGPAGLAEPGPAGAVVEEGPHGGSQVARPADVGVEHPLAEERRRADIGPAHDRDGAGQGLERR